MFVNTRPRPDTPGGFVCSNRSHTGVPCQTNNSNSQIHLSKVEVPAWGGDGQARRATFTACRSVLDLAPEGAVATTYSYKALSHLQDGKGFFELPHGHPKGLAGAIEIARIERRLDGTRLGFWQHRYVVGMVLWEM